MKNLVHIFSLLFVSLVLISCQPQEQQAAEVIDHSAEAEAFINKWFTALNAANWQEEVKPLLTEDNDFVSFHKPFREAFPDYHATVKQVVADGETIVAHIKVKASHKGRFPYGEFKDVEPSGKTAEWDEVMSFVLEDGKVTTAGFFLADNLSRMKQYGIECLPQEEAE